MAQANKSLLSLNENSLDKNIWQTIINEPLDDSTIKDIEQGDDRPGYGPFVWESSDSHLKLEMTINSPTEAENLFQKFAGSVTEKKFCIMDGGRMALKRQLTEYVTSRRGSWNS